MVFRMDIYILKMLLLSELDMGPNNSYTSPRRVDVSSRL
jgi:hypothetical protein